MESVTLEAEYPHPPMEREPAPVRRQASARLSQGRGATPSSPRCVSREVPSGSRRPASPSQPRTSPSHSPLLGMPPRLRPSSLEPARPVERERQPRQTEPPQRQASPPRIKPERRPRESEPIPQGHTKCPPKRAVQNRENARKSLNRCHSLSISASCRSLQDLARPPLPAKAAESSGVAAPISARPVVEESVPGTPPPSKPMPATLRPDARISGSYSVDASKPGLDTFKPGPDTFLWPPRKACMDAEEISGEAQPSPLLESVAPLAPAAQPSPLFEADKLGAEVQPLPSPEPVVPVAPAAPPSPLFEVAEAVVPVLAEEVLVLQETSSAAGSAFPQTDVAPDVSATSTQPAAVMGSPATTTAVPEVAVEVAADFVGRESPTSGNEDKHHVATSALVEEDQVDSPEPAGALALRSIDQAVVEQICSSRLAEMRNLLPAPEQSASTLGTWMIWMVHRVSENDPKLTSLNFRNLAMPASEDEPRIAAKLVTALARNTHLTELSLCCSNLQGEQARGLGRALAANKTLEVLNVQSNNLEPSALRDILAGLAGNNALKEFRCDQFCSEEWTRTVNEAELSVFVTALEMLQNNFTLQKLGMDLTERHYRDQITKALIRNTEAARLKRKRAQERMRADKIDREKEVHHRPSTASPGAIEAGGA